MSAGILEANSRQEAMVTVIWKTTYKREGCRIMLEEKGMIGAIRRRC